MTCIFVDQAGRVIQSQQSMEVWTLVKNYVITITLMFQWLGRGPV